MNKEMLEKDYFNDLNKIKETIRQNQNKAMVYVNSQMIMTYYQSEEDMGLKIYPESHK